MKCFYALEHLKKWGERGTKKDMKKIQILFDKIILNRNIKWIQLLWFIHCFFVSQDIWIIVTPNDLIHFTKMGAPEGKW